MRTVSELLAAYAEVDQRTMQDTGSHAFTTDPTGAWSTNEFRAVFNAAASASEMEALLRLVTKRLGSFARGDFGDDEDRRAVAAAEALLARLDEARRG